MNINANNNIIKEGDWIIIKSNQSDHLNTEIRIKNNTKIRVRKHIYASLEHVIGHAYGSYFQLDDTKKSLIKCKASKHAYIEVSNPIDGVNNKDNSEIFDRSESNQQLNRDDIEELKSANTKGEEIIEKLTSQSNSYDKKTKFSQEKYVMRKQKKYMTLYQIYKSNSRRLIEVFSQTSPRRIFNLRVDILSYILGRANVRANACSMVFDGIEGIVTAAIAERHAGYGNIIELHEGRSAQRGLFAKCNISNEAKDILLPSPIGYLQELVSDDFKLPPLVNNDENNVAKTNFNERLLQYHERLLKTRSILKENGGADSLIIVARHDPSTLLLPLLKYLKPASQFVVFHSDVARLTSCWQTLLNDQQYSCLNSHICEPFTREYQILPQRTHPDMGNVGFGGFILYGCKTHSP